MRDPKPTSTSTSASADSKANAAGANALSRLPPSSAPPAQVRTFLATLLQETNQTPAPQAQEIAAKWTVGTGRQLRSYPPMMFLDIFGRQDGWLLYREVRLAVHRERTRADWWYRNGTYAVFFAFLALEVVLVASLLRLGEKSHRASLPVLSGFAAGTLFATLLTGFILMMERRTNVADLIEGELRVCMSPSWGKRD